MKLSLRFALWLFVAVSTSQYTPSEPQQTSTPTRDDNLALGNPAGAVNSLSSPEAYLIPG